MTLNWIMSESFFRVSQKCLDIPLCPRSRPCLLLNYYQKPSTHTDVCLLGRAANFFRINIISVIFSIQNIEQISECLSPAVEKSLSNPDMTSKNTRSSADDDKRDHRESYVARVFSSINTSHLDDTYSSSSQQLFQFFPKTDRTRFMLVARLSLFKKGTFHCDVSASSYIYNYQKKRVLLRMSPSLS